MGEHAALGRNIEFAAYVVEHHEQLVSALRAVSRRIDADHGIARAEQQAVENTGRDTAQVIGWMIGLEPHREPAGQADRVAKSGHDAAFRRDQHQVLEPADLADRRRHFRGQPRRQRRQPLRGRFVGQQPVAKAADCERGYRRKRRLVMGIDDQPRDLVGLVSHDGFIEEGRQRQIGQRELRSDALLAALRCQPGELVAAAQRRRFGEHRLEVAEAVSARADRRRVHVVLLSRTETITQSTCHRDGDGP
jgi:hypothetical protein